MVDDISSINGLFLHPLPGLPFPLVYQPDLSRSLGRCHDEVTHLDMPPNELVKLCSPGIEFEEAPAGVVGHEDGPELND